MADLTQATLIEVKNYFGYDSPTAFAKDWKQLSDQDKTQLKVGIGNGTFTY